MKKEILYTTALDTNGNIVHINAAEKGNQYYCPECKNEFILRKSGKTGKGSKRPHFAHNNISPNCTPEGVLHKSFKKLLVDLLRQYTQENKTLIVDWACIECALDYSKLPIPRDLLKNVVSIEEEYNLKVCRPDIALLDKEKNVIGVVEVVVTHAPEENAIQYYNGNGITFIQINLNSDEDISKVEEKVIKPDMVNYCLNPKCENLGSHSVKRELRTGILACRGCRQPVNTFQLVTGSVFGNLITALVTENELKIIESKGVLYKMKRDSRTGIQHPMVICKTCELRKRMRRNRSKRQWRL